MKLLHTDREPANSNPNDIQVTPEDFMKKMTEQQPAQKPLDLSPATTEQPQQPAKANSKAWVWVLVIVVVIALIIAIRYYVQQKQQQENNG